MSNTQNDAYNEQQMEQEADRSAMLGELKKQLATIITIFVINQTRGNKEESISEVMEKIINLFREHKGVI